MTTLKISNPFNAPVYHEETVTSTMDVSRALALHGEPHGTVITADFQGAGRGRIRDRSWLMEEKSGLPFTVLLRYPRVEEIPPALTLRVGLAVSLAIEDFAPSLKGKVTVKWPNDIMIDSKKVSGILCEADGGTIHAGIGINFSQKEFPAPLREKAASVALASGLDLTAPDRFRLLEKNLACLFDELEKTKGGENWKPRLEQRLYKKDEDVVFMEGAAGSGREVKGRLAGITEIGELLIIPNGETQPCSFITGELTFL